MNKSRFENFSDLELNSIGYACMAMYKQCNSDQDEAMLCCRKIECEIYKYQKEKNKNEAEGNKI